MPGRLLCEAGLGWGVLVPDSDLVSSLCAGDRHGHAILQGPARGRERLWRHPGAPLQPALLPGVPEVPKLSSKSPPPPVSDLSQVTMELFFLFRLIPPARLGPCIHRRSPTLQGPGGGGSGHGRHRCVTAARADPHQAPRDGGRCCSHTLPCGLTASAVILS